VDREELKRQTFLGVAQLISGLGTCQRAKVGAVLVMDGMVVATGYNGSPTGKPHCIDEGCIMSKGHCVRTIHAEINCMINAAKAGIATNAGTIYTTHTPCNNCTLYLYQAGIKKVFYDGDYGNSELFREYYS